MGTIIFDFDGTIADTFTLFEKDVEIVAKRLKITVPVRLKDFKNLPAKEAFKEAKIPLWKLPRFARMTKQYLHEHTDRVALFKGLVPVLNKLAKKHTLGIITSNSVENVECILAKHKVKCFSFVISAHTIFGKHRAIKRVMREKKLKEAHTIYVGDEVRDIQASKKAHVRIASVTWGFNTAKILKAYEPDFLFSTPKHLLQLEEHL